MSALHTVPLATILGLWTELEEARFGHNSYGGDTAEVYVYRLLRSRPHTVQPDDADLNAANDALHELVEMFGDAHPDCRVAISPPWTDHRWHLKVSARSLAAVG